MLEMYKTDLATNKTEIATKYEKGNWINMIAPSEEEIIEVCKNLQINEDFIRYALDYEEKARIDVEEDEDILEDAIIENKQAIEMAKIYSDILNGTMDAYASIISNNLNRVMKFLTSITIILSIPTMIASFWGMNVPVPMQDNPYGFVILIGFSVIISIIATVWLNKRDMLK